MSPSTISEFERRTPGRLSLAAVRYLKSVLEAAGVEFIANEPGVRLRKAKT
jgi:hypothetical protein